MPIHRNLVGGKIIHYKDEHAGGHGDRESAQAIQGGAEGGGVLSPLLWKLNVNRVSGETLRKLQTKTTIPKQEWRVAFQVFADDISSSRTIWTWRDQNATIP